MAPLLATPMALWFSSRIVRLRFSVPVVKPFCIGSVDSLLALDLLDADDSLDSFGVLDLPVVADAVLTGVELDLLGPGPLLTLRAGTEAVCADFDVFDSDLLLLDVVDVSVLLEVDDFLMSEPKADIAMKPSVPFLPSRLARGAGARC